MAPSLPDLPAEVLFLIMQSYGKSWERTLTEKLRSTCKQLNEKLVFFYGSTYFTSIDVNMNGDDLTTLHSLARGNLGMHVQSLSIHTTTLVERTEVSMYSDSSSQSDGSWYSYNEMDDCTGKTSYFRFDEDVLKLLTDGTCVKVLARALGDLRSLNSITIHPPVVLDTDCTHGMKQKKLEEVKLRWSMALRALLPTVFSYGPLLQVLHIKATQPSVPVPISTLNLFALSPHRLTLLRRFEVNLDIDIRSAEWPVYVQILPHFFSNAVNLCQLKLSFEHPERDYKFFKLLAKALPQMALQSLHLARIHTRFKYWAMLLRSCRKTLWSLTMEEVSFEGDVDDYPVFDLLCDELKLRSCVLDSVLFGYADLDIEPIHAERPTCRVRPFLRSNDLTHDEDWLWVDTKGQASEKLRLCEKEGDDVAYWLDRVRQVVV